MPEKAFLVQFSVHICKSPCHEANEKGPEALLHSRHVICGDKVLKSMVVFCRYVPAYKLVDVPELGYTTKDKPYPRGELRIKTVRLISGYYKHPEVSAQPRVCGA